MNPVLLDIPDSFETERLFIRVRKDGDELKINEAVVETYEYLNKWIPSVDHIPSIEETKEHIRRSISKFILRQALDFIIFLKNSNTFIGSIGTTRIEWNIPLVELGYWIRKSHQGKGYASEALEGMTKYAFELINAKRVELRVDPKNIASIKVAEKLGFGLEGILKNEFYSKSEGVCDTAIYAKIK